MSRRAHSRGELVDKLARAGYDGEDVRRALAYLDERRYLDDAAFARDFARSRSERKHWGPARIARRLRELRLSEAEIEAALAEVFREAGTEEEAAGRALARFLARKGAGGGRKGQARAYRHLLSKGFSPEVAHGLVSRHDFEDTGRNE